MAVKFYKALLQKRCQQIATIIDHGLPCLATGKSGNLVGGHVWSKGAHEECRFNLHNIHRQDFFSNGSSTDDKLMWLGLLLEYGEEYRDKVLSLKGGPLPKLKEFQYKELYQTAGAIIDYLLNRNDKLPRRVELRIELRDFVNKELGIYE